MGSLYVSSVPAGSPEDLTLRALRIAREASLVVAAEVHRAAELLRHHGVTTPVVELARSVEVLAALERGDVLLLLEGGSASPSPLAQALVESALSTGHRVVPVPGPSLPMTALVISGLPTDSFLYVDHLPDPSSTRRELLTWLAGERRTLVLPAETQAVRDLLAELHVALRDRQAVLVAASVSGVEVVWRGRLGGEPAPLSAGDPASYVLVVGGAHETVPRWEEARLKAEIQAQLRRGVEAKEVARQLAADSGWPRRQIYRLAVDVARLLADRQVW